MHAGTMQDRWEMSWSLPGLTFSRKPSRSQQSVTTKHVARSAGKVTKRTKLKKGRPHGPELCAERTSGFPDSRIPGFPDSRIPGFPPRTARGSGPSRDSFNVNERFREARTFCMGARARLRACTSALCGARVTCARLLVRCADRTRHHRGSHMQIQFISVSL